MATFKVVIADPKSGKCYQKEADESAATSFLGLKIGDEVRGEVLNLTGYVFTITGGSDSSGFPMRADLPGTSRKKILAVSGVGIKKKEKGTRQRKTVRGNTIAADIAQINLKITTFGKESLEPKPEGEAKEKEADSKAENGKDEEKKPDAKDTGNGSDEKKE